MLCARIRLKAYSTLYRLRPARACLPAAMPVACAVRRLSCVVEPLVRSGRRTTARAADPRLEARGGYLLLGSAGLLILYSFVIGIEIRLRFRSAPLSLTWQLADATPGTPCSALSSGSAVRAATPALSRFTQISQLNTIVIDNTLYCLY
jgi:hypothetical protein